VKYNTSKRRLMHSLLQDDEDDDAHQVSGGGDDGTGYVAGLLAQVITKTIGQLALQESGPRIASSVSVSVSDDYLVEKKCR
jgi:hypothetical protein